MADSEKGQTMYDDTIEAIADQIEAERSEVDDRFDELDLEAFGLRDVWQEFMAAEVWE